MAHGFRKELLNGDNHIQLFKGSFQLVAVKILRKGIFAGYPEHFQLGILGIQNFLGNPVDVQRAVGIGGLFPAAKVKLALGAAAAHKTLGACGALLRHGVVVETPGLQMPVACAAALNAHVACHGHKGIHGAHHGPAVGVALHAVANPHGRGVGRSKFFRHRADFMGGYARNLRRPLHGDVGPQVGRKFVKTHGPVFDKILIHKSGIQQMAGHAERQRAIAASAHLPVHIALGRSLGKDGVNNHHLGALLPGLVDVLHGVHGTPRRVCAPHDDVLGLDHVFRVVAPHVAEVVVLGVNARRPAGRAHKAAGVAEGRHHAFHAVVGDAEVAGILGKAQPQQVAVLFLQLQNLV